MKIWTIQSYDVIEIIEKNETYFADFKKSSYLRQNENLKEIYTLLLNSFNHLNNESLSGLIFGFATSTSNNIIEIESIQSFKDFLNDNADIIGGFINKIDKSNSVIIELDLEVDFNPVCLDINDFQFLMPPIMIMHPFTKESVNRIVNNIANGICEYSELPTKVFQFHIPYIKKSDIVNIYKFDLDYRREDDD